MLLTGIARRALAALACLAVACSPKSSAGEGPDAQPTCAAGFIGDEAGALDFDLQVLHADDTVAPLNDGDAVPMILPPQGGRVLFVGVRAKNVDGCGVQLSGALRDLASQHVQFDSRTINLIPTGDGYGVSGTAMEPVSAAISSFSNIPVCPNEWSNTDVYGTPYGLEVTLKDREGRQLTKKIKVTPECGEPANLSQCLCECMAGYVLGQACDAGIDQ